MAASRGLGAAAVTGPDPLAASVLVALAARQATVATAESLTGGRLAARFTSVPGASVGFLGGVVAYATDLKTDLLGVPEELVATHGVVSAQCARAMALGVLRLTGAAYSLSTTGVAGPDRQEGQPPGTVFVGVGAPDGCEVLVLELTGDRDTIVERTCQEALSALSRVLTHGEEPLR